MRMPICSAVEISARTGQVAQPRGDRVSAAALLRHHHGSLAQNLVLSHGVGTTPCGAVRRAPEEFSASQPRAAVARWFLAGEREISVPVVPHPV